MHFDRVFVFDVFSIACNHQRCNLFCSQLTNKLANFVIGLLFTVTSLCIRSSPSRELVFLQFTVY